MKKVRDDLYRRILLNRLRLNDSLYRYEKVFTETSSWPGDFPGRAILALVSLYDAFDGYSTVKDDILSQLKDIFCHIDEYLNKDNYFGIPFNNEFVDEQQVAGNSWYLRGLIGYYKITKEEKYLDQIKSIVKNFLNPISSFYSHYPTIMRDFGGVGGHITEELYDGWRLSSDIGCAFIMIDGMTAVYELTKNDALKENLRLIIEKFLTIDFVNLECQTHATLSCARGIYRFYQSTNEEKYLQYAIEIFDKYLSLGMTYDYANINWFNRPTTWTEPCCIVDSMILAKKLYLETKNKKYLFYFNKMYENTIRVFQRDNGGAGCSTCAINEQYSLKMFMYEAFFCCTMRFSEGLKEIVDFTVVKEDNVLLIPFVSSIVYKDKDFEVIVDNKVYKNNKLSIKVKKAPRGSIIKLYLPFGEFVNKRYSLNEENLLVLDVEENGSYDIEYYVNLDNDNGFNYLGDRLLSKKEHHFDKIYIIDGEEYSLLYDHLLFNEEQLTSLIQYLK